MRYVLVALLGVTVGGFLGARSTTVSTQDFVGAPIPQPSAWVPFAADLEIQVPTGALYKGRFHRDRNGSVRREWDQAPGVRRVMITNFRERVTYSAFLGTERPWTRRPLRRAESSYAPPEWREGRPGLSKYRHRLAIAKGDSQSLTATEGFEAWLFNNAEGGSLLMVPDLNLYPVVSNALNGLRESLTHIEIGDVPDELFTPPLGAVVTDGAPLRVVPGGQEPSGDSD